MEFEAGEVVVGVTDDEQGAAERRGRFLRPAAAAETIIVYGREVEAAWVEWLDGDDAGTPGLLARFSLERPSPPG